MKKFGLLLVLSAALGCGTDSSVTVPENATAVAPEEGNDEGSDEDADKGPGEEHKLKPR